MPAGADGDAVVLSRRYTDAVSYVAEVSAGQRRKGTPIPYLSHLLAVSALVLEDGGDEDEAIGALLHDVVEDQPLRDGDRLAEVRGRFGDRVAGIVEDCSAEARNGRDGRATWRERKQGYIDRMGSTASPAAVRVSLADKLHNARAILADYRRVGGRLWERFNAPDPESVVAYYRELLSVYRQRISESMMVDELDRVIGQLCVLMRSPDCPRCGAGDVVPIVYGYPGVDMRSAQEAGMVSLGGCVIHGADPDRQCRCCGRPFHSGDVCAQDG